MACNFLHLFLKFVSLTFYSIFFNLIYIYILSKFDTKFSENNLPGETFVRDYCVRHEVILNIMPRSELIIKCIQ
jgi:hypothetical protein